MNTYTQEMIKRVTEQSKLDDVKYAKEAQKEAKKQVSVETRTYKVNLEQLVCDVNESDYDQTYISSVMEIMDKCEVNCVLPICCPVEIGGDEMKVLSDAHIVLAARNLNWRYLDMFLVNELEADTKIWLEQRKAILSVEIADQATAIVEIAQKGLEMKDMIIEGKDMVITAQQEMITELKAELDDAKCRLEAKEAEVVEKEGDLKLCRQIKNAKNGNLLETQKIFRGVKDVRSSDDYQTICDIVKNATGTRKEIAQQLYNKGYCRIVKGKIAPLSTLTIKAL